MNITPYQYIIFLMSEKTKYGENYRFLITQLSRLQILQDPQCPTMAVFGNSRGEHKLLYNLNFWRQLHPRSAKHVLVHEALHYVLAHVYRALMLQAEFCLNEQHMLWLRQAAEITVNHELLKIFPEINYLVTSDDGTENHKILGTEAFLVAKKFNIPAGLSLEENFVALMQKEPSETPELTSFLYGLLRTAESLAESEKQTTASSSSEEDASKNISNDLSVTNENVANALAAHNNKNTANDLTTLTSKLLHLKACNNKSLLESAKQRTFLQIQKTVKSWGTDSENIAEICPYLNPPKLNFTEILQHIISTKLKDKKRTLLHPSRRRQHLVLAFPGKKHSKGLCIVWITDTSSSMDNTAISKGLGLLRKLQKLHQHTVWVVEADCQVQKIYELDSHKKIEYNIIGRGGTSFDPALEASIKLNPDLVFYYTDGYAPPPNVRVDCPLYFLITKNGKYVPGHKNILIGE